MDFFLSLMIVLLIINILSQSAVLRSIFCVPLLHHAALPGVVHKLKIKEPVVIIAASSTNTILTWLLEGPSLITLG